MAFRLKRRKAVGRQLADILADEIRKAENPVAGRAAFDAGESVHDIRKHIKKARAILRLFGEDRQKGNGTPNARLRAVAHQLSAVRDAEAAAEIVRQLRRLYRKRISASTSSAMRRQLLARRRRAKSRLEGAGVRAKMQRALTRARKSIPSRLRRTTDGAVRAAMRRGYRRARKAMARAETQRGDLLFHTWRRRVKDHWYHMRLAEGLNRSAAARVRRLKQLETWLGDEHNLVVLHDIVAGAPSQFGDGSSAAAILGCIEKYQATLRRRALAQGRRMFAAKPAAFGAWIDEWWRS